MGDLVISLEVSGVTQLGRGFSRFADQVKDARPALKEIADDFHNVVERNQFDSQGGASGGWAALSPVYAAWKAKYCGNPILVLGGALRASLEGRSSETIEEINPQSVRLGTRNKTAMWHQTGTSRMPARPPIDLLESDKKRWTDIVHEYLVTRAREVGHA